MIDLAFRSAALGGALSLAACAAGAAELNSVKVGNWKVAAYSDDASGGFSHCASHAAYRSGVGLLFSVNKNLDWSLGFQAQRWSMKKGESYEVRYQVDNGPVRTSKAVAITATLVQMDLPDQASIFNEFRYGRVLKAEGGDERLNFALTDTQFMLAEVLRCADTWRKRAVARNEAAPRLSPAPAGPSDADRRLEATTIAVNLLSRAKVAGFELMQGAELPDKLKAHHAAWRAEGILGTVRVLTGEDGPEKIRGGLISSDAQACTDRFASGAMPDDGGKGLSLFTACDGEKGWAAVYIAVPRQKGGFYVVSLLGKPDRADEVKTVSAAFRSAAGQVAGY